MGACSSAQKRGLVRKSLVATTALEEKVVKALQQKLEEQSKLEHPMTLERILLKFDRMSDVLGYVKDVFLQYSNDGHCVDIEGLTKALTSLKGSDPSDDEVREIFNFADLTENVKINLKEFVVALVLGLVLGTLNVTGNLAEQQVKLAPSPRRQSMSIKSTNADVYKMLQLILSAYLLFDINGDGCIYRENVENILEEQGRKQTSGGGNVMLSQERWKELDWDENGTIDLAEFVNAFTMWVDIDEVLNSV
jgi:Ca2+-binding EF-hand superfamily protein